MSARWSHSHTGSRGGCEVSWEIVSLGYVGCELVVGPDEILQELMQPALEDIVHLSRFKSSISIARLLLAAIGSAIILCQSVERTRDPLIAESQRPRHLLAQNEEFGHQPGPVGAVAIDPSIRTMG